MDKKISDVNEMIEQNRIDEHDDDDDVKETTNNCGSGRSTPTSVNDKEMTNKQNDDNEDDAIDNDDASEMRDNGGRCSVNSNNVNSSTRTMADELTFKDKEVSFLDLFSRFCALNNF
jgi:hypothetical protein